MDFDIRPIVEEEYEPWLKAIDVGFGSHTRDSDPPRLRPTFKLDRTVAAFDDGRPVSGAHSYPLEMVAPGGSLVVAGVNAVAVQPTHRRRGILTGMMAHQLRDLHQRGEAVAVLFAAESVIYGRFGYGTATFYEGWTIDRQHTAFARPHEAEGRTAFVAPEEMRKVFPDVYRRATERRPGALQLPDYAWDQRAEDLEHHRGETSASFHVVYERDGGVDGYVSYRIQGATVHVSELMSTSREAHAALFGYCFGIDLRSTVKAPNRPVDDALSWMLANPRGLLRSLHDGMYLRLVEVAKALSARDYSIEGRLVLEVRDSFCSWNEGRFELEAGPEGAECSPSSASPDVVLSASDLASVYLGTVPFTTLARAGRIEERTANALRRADAMFATERAPWCPYMF